MNFYLQHLPSLKEAGKPMTEIASYLGGLWRSMSEEEKEAFRGGTSVK